MTTPLRVLYVEDEPKIRELNHSLLRSYGLGEVTAAGSLTEAERAMLSGEKFDLLISDFNLGDGCGTKLLLHCERCEVKCVVFLSGSDPRQILAEFSRQQFPLKVWVAIYPKSGDSIEKLVNWLQS